MNASSASFDLVAGLLRCGLLLAILAILIYTFYFSRKRFPVVREFAQFMLARKLWWMTPMVVVFLFLALLVVTAENSGLMAFIYILF